MHATQLACPHCSSSLTFGMEIAAGSAVECLICCQPFLAENPVQVALEMPKPPPAAVIEPRTTATPPVGKPAMLSSKPAQAPQAAPQPNPRRAVPPAIPKGKSEPRRVVDHGDEEPGADSIPWGMIAATVVGLLLLTVGIGLGLWKLTGGGGEPAADTLVAETKPNGTPVVQPTPGDPPAVEPPASAQNAGKDDDEKSKMLVRKPRPKGSSDLELPEVPAFTVVRSMVPGVDQEKIDRAIAQGVQYLRQRQDQATGSWSGQSHQVGHASLGGLTLLECKAAPDDQAVLRAAAFVRSKAERLNHTYELSLAVLFLDRLGDPRDKGLIQGMALRLLAGQTDSGGWSYTCPLLTPQEMHQLYNFVHVTRPVELFDPVRAGDPLANPSKKPTTLPSAIASGPGMNDPFQQLSRLILDQGVAGEPAKKQPDEPKKGGLLQPLDPNAPPAKTPEKGKTPKTPTKAKTPQVVNPNTLPPALRNLPVVQTQGRGKGQIMVRQAAGDNSNTQFALLALWAARRNGVPTDRALLIAHQRFVSSQGAEGAWGYTTHSSNGSPAMTGVGLLGLAMGHGASPDMVFADPLRPNLKDATVKPALEDPQIQKGLRALSRHVGVPLQSAQQKPGMENLYFLWTVERVAMLYDLKTIGGKDWYGWGAQLLVANQSPDGHWNSANYHGHNANLDTCFALLFLKRSNLVQDLTENLRLNMAIRDPDQK